MVNNHVSHLFSCSSGKTKIKEKKVATFTLYLVGNFFCVFFFSRRTKMDSRKTTRSSFSNGRSSSGEDSNGNCRPNGCSYISNVRPENRYMFTTNPVWCHGMSRVSVVMEYPQYPYNTPILKDFHDLSCGKLFVCCHGHQPLNKLLIRNSISVTQHGPNFTSSSTNQHGNTSLCTNSPWIAKILIQYLFSS